jgi:Mandelate racemase / muconate lactonizing enzyme, N-terminal domain
MFTKKKQNLVTLNENNFTTMKKYQTKFSSSRRETMKMLALSSTAALLGPPGSLFANTQKTEIPAGYKAGMPPVKIRSVKAIATAPEGSNLVVVKVETTEPGLYGLGCATFTQRAVAVVAAIDSYLNDFCIGKDVDNIEDMWQSCYVSSYWRNGPVLNNALSGLDEALWDIKGVWRCNVLHIRNGRFFIQQLSHFFFPWIAAKIKRYQTPCVAFAKKSAKIIHAAL